MTTENPTETTTTSTELTPNDNMTLEQLIFKHIKKDDNVVEKKEDTSNPVYTDVTLTLEENTPRVSKALANLAKKELKLLDKEKSIKEKEERFAKYELIEERLKKNPAKVLQELGITAEQYYSDVMENEDAPLDPIQEVKKLREDIAEEKRQLKTQNEENQVNFHKKSIEDLISSDDRFELIKVNDATDEVWNTMVEAYERSDGKEVMQYEEAALLVEKYYELEAEKLLKTKKFSSKVPDKKSLLDKLSETSISGKKPSPSLSNKMSTTGEDIDISSLPREEAISALMKKHGIHS
jgi:hypothetical protein